VKTSLEHIGLLAAVAVVMEPLVSEVLAEVLLEMQAVLQLLQLPIQEAHLAVVRQLGLVALA
jgi:hypothetical protein